MNLDIKLTPKQLQFVNATADEVLYGGAAGGGKSYGQLIDALLYAIKYAHSKQILFRRTYPELEKSIIRTAQELYPPELCRYIKSAHTYVFYNGSIIDFGYLDNEGDLPKYQSAEYDVIRFDELTHFTERMYVYMTSRLRGANPYPKSMRSSTNPGGVGHTWVKARFIDIGGAGETHTVTTNGEQLTRIFIPAKVTDNVILMKNDEGYVKRLHNLNEHDRKALLDGVWDLNDGLFFDNIKRGLQIVSGWDIPADWNRYFVMDYGLDMLAGYMVAVDHQGWCYVYREVYDGKDSGGKGLIVSEAAKRIKELVASDKVMKYYAPPDLWNRQKDTGKSIAQLFGENGIPLTKTSNDRVQGWFSLQEMLKETTNESGQPASRLRIFNNCVNLVRCITSIQTDEKNPNDVANNPHELTHSVDAMRYFASAHYRAPSAPKAAAHYNFKSERPKQNNITGGKIKVI